MVGIVVGGGIAQAQPGPNQGPPQNADARAIGGVITALIALQNTNVQANIQDTLNNIANANRIEIVDLNDVLNDSQINVLSDILNNNDILSNNQDVLSNILNDSLNDNTVLQNFLNNNDIDVTTGDIVAVDVLSGGRPVLFVLR